MNWSKGPTEKMFKIGTSTRRQATDSSGKGENSSGESHTREMQSVAARAVNQMVPLDESTTAVALACSLFGEKHGDDELISTSLETETTKPKADALLVSNGVT